MKIVGIVGNNAKFSYNRYLLQFMQQHYSNQTEIIIKKSLIYQCFVNQAQTMYPKVFRI